MGYYAHYSIKIYPSDKHNIRVISKAVNDTADIRVLYGNGTSYSSTKWYNWEDDMISVSKDFPNIIISLFVKGEETEDLARYDFCNGEMVSTWEFDGIPSLSQDDINFIINP
jgi:hypothetical protein